MLSLQEVSEVIYNLAFGYWPMRIVMTCGRSDYSDNIEVLLSMHTLDKKTGQPMAIRGALSINPRKIDALAVRKEIMDFIEKIVLHEFRENVTYGGKHIFNPHVKIGEFFTLGGKAYAITSIDEEARIVKTEDGGQFNLDELMELI